MQRTRSVIFAYFCLFFGWGRAGMIEFLLAAHTSRPLLGGVQGSGDLMHGSHGAHGFSGYTGCTDPADRQKFQEYCQNHNKSLEI